ncbi:MAG: AAA family ATPase [Actinomycetota bacterium]
MSDLSTLTEISIKNIGVIEDATLELDKGFTVLTGETGAGKTMVLTALALVLGGKADSSLLGKEEIAWQRVQHFAFPRRWQKRHLNMEMSLRMAN